ncbi:MAG: hypothetical protein KBT06_10640 [Prevotellaceae bacterium]|nr:hypothetical protein [Candidatus Colivivens equi]
MTFEVPESKSIDIEALKLQIQAFVSAVTAVPNIRKNEKNDMAHSIRPIDNKKGNWRTWKISPELMDIVSETSKVKFSDDDPFYKNAIENALTERYESLS